MPSEIKRFISYLKDNVKAHDRNGATAAAARPARVADIDFAEIAALLSKYKDDERIRNVLMDPSDNKLQGALDDVLQELKEVEAVSIAAYIEEAEPLNILHGQVRRCPRLQRDAVL
jgi:cytochrome c553